MGNYLIWGLGVLVILLGGLGLFGPREPVVTDIQFDEFQLGSDIDAYFAAQESQFSDITPGVEKQVLWQGATGEKTDWAVLYIHGFSATLQEVRPLPDIVANDLGANLVFTRLAGHGRSGAAMTEATVEAWMTDMAEALAVARAVGDKVLVMATSTGGTLATLAAHEEMSAQVAGMVLVAPNFQIKDSGAPFLTWPGARWWGPWVAGKERGFEPRTEEIAKFWTSRYPFEAVLPMAAAVKAAQALPHEDVTIPALFVFDDLDEVVNHAKTREIAARWGAKADLNVVDTLPDDDPSRHVIAGDLVSPGMTEGIAARTLEWVAGL
ncbi:MAG: alpha/beta fold hydrolase [Paracoccaceae bacterium]|nr:alpha/beta fold hydrolase [Paracoccaceae bacterium]